MKVFPPCLKTSAAPFFSDRTDCPGSNTQINVTLAPLRQRLHNLSTYALRTILGDPGAYSGGKGKSKRAEKMARRKVKNGEKSPWQQCLTRPVTNGRGRFGFWLVPENVFVFLPNQSAADLGVISCVLTRTVHELQLFAMLILAVRGDL